MPRVEIIMPQMGESIAEGTIVKWHKKVGDRVEKDETLLEISTDKVDSEIPSPAAGILSQIVVDEQGTVPVRTVIGYLETDGGGELPAPKPVDETAAKAETPSVAVPEAIHPSPKPSAGRFYSPLVLSIARTEGVSMSELETIPGTGEGGRVTKKDIAAYVAAKRGAAPQPSAGVSAPPPVKPAPLNIAVKPVDVPELRAKYPPPQHEILQMGTILQKMADHMVKSVHTSPHVSAVHEVDMSKIVHHRAEHATEFEKKEGYKLTFTPYIVDAVVKAIKKYPLINSSIEGDKIIRKNFINLGIAVASENGLIVPVIKHADEKSFLGVARAVNDLAVRARNRRLTPDDIQGGTFTISNYGVFGTMIGTPIINQPQVAILGAGAITKRPVVVNDAIAIRSIAYLTLSFDHRIVDGALGGMFLEEVARNLEDCTPDLRL